MKVAQLEKDFQHKYRFIVIDESQDMTPCQAELFWGQERLDKENAPAVFIVGDTHQRIYGFRGASHSFEQTKVDVDFHLTGSFRFGDNIARVANLIMGPEVRICGLSTNEGGVRPGKEFSRGGNL